MERDFLSLNCSSKESVALEDEVCDGSLKDPSSSTTSSVFMRGSVMQWPFSNKVSALPHIMPYNKTIQEDRSKKTVLDPLVSSSTADAPFDAHHKSFIGLAQKNFNFDRQGGINAFHNQHFDALSVHRPYASVSTMSNSPFFRTNAATTSYNFNAMRQQQQPLGGIPITTPHSTVPMFGTVDQRNISKPAMASTQMTVFYGGSMTVYDNISPEKAQAIMFLAGHGSSTNNIATNSQTQEQALIPKPLGDGSHGTQSYSSHCSGLSSPMSATSLASGQSGCCSNGSDAVKSLGDLPTPIRQPEPPKTIASLGSAASTLIPAAVPQARKASLARFLEKRKERVMNTMPYNMNTKAYEGSTTPSSSSIILSGNFTEAGGCVSVSKELSWSLGPATDNERRKYRLQRPPLGI